MFNIYMYNNVHQYVLSSDLSTHLLSVNFYCQALVPSLVPLDPIPIPKVQLGPGLTLNSDGVIIVSIPVPWIWVLVRMYRRL